MRPYLFFLLYVGFLPTIFFSPFAGALLWAWISLMQPQQMVWIELPLSPALIIVIMMMFAQALSRDRKFPPNTLVTWAMIGMMLSVSMAQVAAINFELSFSRWDNVIKGLFMCLVILALLDSRLRIHALTWALVISIGYHGAKNGAQSLITGGAWRGGGPAGSMIGDNNHVATAMAMIVPLMVYLAFHSAKRYVRIGCWALAFVTLIAVLFTYSRGGMLAMAAMLGVLWLRSSRKLPILLALAGFAIFVVQFAPDQLWERFGMIREYEADDSATGRLRIWRVALVRFAENPVFGIGFHATTLPEVVQPIDPTLKPKAIHNSYLEALAEGGIFTFIFHVMLLASGMLQVQKVRRLTRALAEWRWAYDLASMIQVGLTGYAVGSFFLSLAFFDGFWFVVVLSTALRLLVQEALGPARRTALSRAQPAFGLR